MRLSVHPCHMTPQRCEARDHTHAHRNDVFFLGKILKRVLCSNMVSRKREEGGSGRNAPVASKCFSTSETIHQKRATFARGTYTTLAYDAVGDDGHVGCSSQSPSRNDIQIN